MKVLNSFGVILDKIRNASGERGACLISVMKFDEQGKHGAKVLLGPDRKMETFIEKAKTT